MKKKLFLLVFFTCLSGWFYISSTGSINPLNHSDFQAEPISDTVPLLLKRGDILVRPNWSWLPGSYPINEGRVFGHVAIVTEDVAGKSIDDALAKASVIEAVVFDQKTRKFIFNRTDRVRETKASISFGPRFKGIRYRLRINLTDQQTNDMLAFLRNQLQGDYAIFSAKRFVGSNSEKAIALHGLKGSGWHCASIAWQAFYLACGVDIDENKGFVVYPADIIASKYFNSKGGRIRF
jgi:hypothetical protein